MKYRSGYKYQLASDYTMKTPIEPDDTVFTEFILLNEDGMLQIKSGYAWDGPSGPTWDTDNTMVPSLFHDVIYQLLRKKLLPTWYRKKADDYMNKLLEERGMFWLRRLIWKSGLKFAQGKAALPKNIKKVYEVE